VVDIDAQSGHGVAEGVNAAGTNTGVPVPL
jgi:hypothetical protein